MINRPRLSTGHDPLAVAGWAMQEIERSTFGRINRDLAIKNEDFVVSTLDVGRRSSSIPEFNYGWFRGEADGNFQAIIASACAPLNQQGRWEASTNRLGGHYCLFRDGEDISILLFLPQDFAGQMPCPIRSVWMQTWDEVVGTSWADLLNLFNIQLTADSIDHQIDELRSEAIQEEWEDYGQDMAELNEYIEDITLDHESEFDGLIRGNRKQVKHRLRMVDPDLKLA